MTKWTNMIRLNPPKNIGLFILIFFSAVFSYELASQSIDLKVLKSLNKNSYPLWDNIMWGTSASIFVTAPGAIITVAVDGIVHNDPVMKRNAYKSAITLGLATVVTT